MDFVTSRIAIGCSQDAKGFPKKVGACLNVAFDLDIPVNPDWEYEKVGLIDGPGNNLETLLAAVYMLKQLLERHEKVLVHCHSGRSRSAAVVATYMMCFHQMSLDSAIQLVEDKHNETSIHEALQQLAKEFYENIMYSSHKQL